MAKKKISRKKRLKKGGRKKSQGTVNIFLIVGLVLAIVMLPTTFMLVFGMLPTVVAFFTDKSKKKARAITVGSMNVAGISPFLLELWFHGHNFNNAISLLTDPKSIVVIYAAAGVGYMIDWGMTNLASVYILQRSKSRIVAIKKRQRELSERWGEEVTGNVVVDSEGFRVDGEP